MRTRTALLAGVVLYIAGGLLGWLKTPAAFGEGSTARLDEVFEPRVAVWLTAFAPLIGLLGRGKRMLALCTSGVAVLVAGGLVVITWSDAPVGSQGETEPAVGLIVSTAGIALSAVAVAAGLIRALRRTRRQA